MGSIVCNAIVLAIAFSEGSYLQGVTGITHQRLPVFHLAFTLVFLLEFILRVAAHDYNRFISQQFNVYDGFCLALAFLQLLFFSRFHHAVETFRILRVFRFLRKDLDFHIIWTTLCLSLNIWPFVVLYTFFVYAFGLLGLSLFPDTDSFDSLLSSMSSVFYLSLSCLKSELFSDVQSLGSLSLLYFFTLFLTSFCLLTVLLGMLYQNITHARKLNNKYRILQALGELL